MTTLPIDRTRFTEPQRRRAEALNVVCHLFPVAVTGKTQFDLAHWIITGKLPT